MLPVHLSTRLLVAHKSIESKEEEKNLFDSGLGHSQFK